MRLGHINFLNVLPLTYGYERLNDRAIKLTMNVPTTINRLLEDDTLDVSQISSIAFARMSKRLILLPDVCVRADDEVESIVLVSRLPIEQLDGAKLIVTSKSETARCLLRIILTKAYALTPDYETRPVDPNHPIADDAIASLLIGDDALNVFHHRPTNFYCYDLGREWHRMTGRSMVYAVWAARNTLDGNSLARVREYINRAMEFGLAHKAEAIRAELERKPFTFEQLDHYLGGVIKWDLTTEHLSSLQKFYDLAREIGALEQTPAVAISPSD